MTKAERNVDVEYCGINSSLSVSELGEVQLECGRKYISRNNQSSKSTPLLPLLGPLSPPSVIDSQNVEINIQDSEFKSQSVTNTNLMKLNVESTSDLCRDPPVNKGVLNKKYFRGLLKKWENKNEEIVIHLTQQQRNARKNINLSQMESYGIENLFNGSCVRVLDDFIFHTGNDGVLKIQKFDESNSSDDIFSTNSEQVTKITEDSDSMLDHTRIYSLDVRKTGQFYLITARYRFGFSFWSFDGLTCSQIASIPSKGLSCCHLTDSQVCLLDTTGTGTVTDINTNIHIVRKYFGADVEKYSWGIVRQGRGLNNICVGTRKQASLFDVRSNDAEVVCKLPDRLYLRDASTILPNIFLTSDEQLQIYDIRNVKQSVMEVNLNFAPFSIVSGTELLKVNEEVWCITSTNRGELRKISLDFTHNSCDFQPVDEDVILKCSSDRKLPDMYNDESQCILGWPDSVAAARLYSDIWLEHSVENRFNIEFRGGAARLCGRSEDVEAVLVNGAGDLFQTSIPTHHPQDSLQQSEYSFKDEDLKLLERWGQTVYSETPLKKTFTRKLLQNISFKERKTPGGLPRLRRSKVIKETCENSTRPKRRKTHLKAKDLRNHKYPEESVSKKVLEIMKPRDEDAISGPEGEVEDVADELNTSQHFQPPQEEDTTFALKSYLSDLGVETDKTLDVTNLSAFLSKD